MAAVIARQDQTQPPTAEIKFLKSVCTQEVPRSPRPKPLSGPSTTPPSSVCRISYQITPEDSTEKTPLIQTAPPSPPPSSSSDRQKQRPTPQDKCPRSAGVPSKHPLQDVRLRHTSSPSLSSNRASVVRSLASLDDIQGYTRATIKIRDLAHIQSIALKDPASFTFKGPLGYRIGNNLTYEISAMPVADIIEMVAGLLMKTISINDREHKSQKSSSNPSPDSSLDDDDDDGDDDEQTPNALAFHGKNIPSISILSYLGRIHKYCPTTYEVFLGLLVYFERMSVRVNALSELLVEKDITNPEATSKPSENELLDVEKTVQSSTPDVAVVKPDIQDSQLHNSLETHQQSNDDSESDPFVIDSFNIHRLIIAGVTCASKFFSDVFYTNSRYAKVGGLPLPELNHLELQFLLLNDFRLSVTIEELNAYGTMLVNFYASQVLAQRKPEKPVETM